MLEINRVKPTPQQLSLWDDTRAVLMYFCPAFTHLFYTLMNKDNQYVAVMTDSPYVPVAATDATSVIVNVNTFFKYTLMERLFILAHEILHNILNHILLLHHLTRSGKVVLSSGKILPFHALPFQYAMDLVINAILVDAKIGKMPENAVFDLKLATHLDSVLDVYEKLIKQQQQGQGPGGQPPPGGQQGNQPNNQPGSQPPQPGKEPGKPGKDDDAGDELTAPGGFDAHLAPGTIDGKDPAQAEAEHNKAEWDVQIKAAMEMALSQGKLPGGLKRLFEEVVEDKIDWTDIVQAWFARKVGSGSADWRHPDRKLIVRDIWAPGRTGFGCDLIVLGCDTSGSIWAEPKVMDKWFGILANILEQLRPKQIIVIWCDAAIGKVDEVEDAGDVADLRQHGVPGGGGTDFRPVFQHIEDQRLEPDGLVFLTDGFGTFPDEQPGYPVFWGGLEGTLAPNSYPFGEVVVVPKD